MKEIEKAGKVNNSSRTGTFAHETGMSEYTDSTGRKLELVFKNDSGEPVTSSLLVAQKFGKRHDNVLQAIRNLERDVAEISENEQALNFKEMQNLVETSNGGWKEQPYYLMNRDGFSLLVMGFTGREALRFKLAFVEAFNRMEARLREATPSLAELYRRVAELEIGVQTRTVEDLDVREDEEAYRFFDSYQTATGDYLDKLTAKEYYSNACVLNAIGYFLKKEYGVRGYTRKYSRSLVWSQLAAQVARIAPEKFPHTLPANPRKLSAKYMNYHREGYKSLIHRGIGNGNARKKRL